MKKQLEKLETATLWRLLEDLTLIIKEPDNTERFSFWHYIYRQIRNEIDKRLESDSEL